MLYEINSVLITNKVDGAAYSAAIAKIIEWIDEGVLEIREVDQRLLRETQAIAVIETHGKGHISSYDATFHALALSEGLELVTADASYVRKAQALVGHVVLLSEFKP